MTYEEMLEVYPPWMYPELYPEQQPGYVPPGFVGDPILDPAATSAPETTPGVPVEGASAEAAPESTPEPVTPPVEVISVDELLDRLTQGDELSAEEPSADDPSAEEPGEELPVSEAMADPGEILADVPVVDPDPVVSIVEQVAGKLIDMIANLDRIEEHLEVIEQTMDHPALTTSFAEYTVTEGLLLLLLLSVFIAACARMLKGGLSWLRS